jgi:DNA-binding response OmpR family regulator
MESRLLIIDDDTKFSRLLGDYLRRFGYVVDTAQDGRQGLEKAGHGNYAAIILDVLLPGMTGWDVLRELRKHSDTPVLMLTALGDEPDRITGLEIGADDYVPKTFSMREVLARLRALLRRSAITNRAKADIPAEPITVGELCMDPAARTAIFGGRELQLTAHEYDLLLALAVAHPRVKTRDQLLMEVAERDMEAFDRSIDVRIAALRKKLGDNARAPRIIETVRSVGYRLRAPGVEPEE